MYANMVTAYDALSPGYKALIADLKGVYTASKVHGNAGYYKNADHPMAMKEKDMKQVEDRFEHPIVRSHPETGVKALFVSVPHIDRFKQMTKEESQPILDYLGRHATKAEFVYRFHWEVGSLALWDDRCVQHYALNDYPGQRREMHRITLKGDAPR
jgi:taurine dioxygenase